MRSRRRRRSRRAQPVHPSRWALLVAYVVALLAIVGLSQHLSRGIAGCFTELSGEPDATTGDTHVPARPTIRVRAPRRATPSRKEPEEGLDAHDGAVERPLDDGE